MISAPTTVQSASTEPTERSMPPVRMTKVMPEASTVLIAIWTKILRKFSGVAKYGRRQREEEHDQHERDGDAGLARGEPQDVVPDGGGAPAAAGFSGFAHVGSREGSVLHRVPRPFSLREKVARRAR